MAMITCPECNKDISGTVKKCPHCGYKLKKQKKKNFTKKFEPKKLCVIISIVVLVLILGVGGVLGYKYYFIPMKNYKTAEVLLKNNKYNNALNMFERLKNFKDSKTRVLEVHYKEAEDLLLSQSYEKAVSEFEKADKYKDAAKKIKETKYIWAGEADVYTAIKLYEDLGDYKDSKDKLQEEREKEKRATALQTFKSVAEGCYNDRITLSSDEKSITVDSAGSLDVDSMIDIQMIIEELGLPDSLYDEMCYTNSLMGRQVETYDYYEVSWSYHPDNGLDVIFKFRY